MKNKEKSRPTNRLKNKAGNIKDKGKMRRNYVKVTWEMLFIKEVVSDLKYQ